MTRNPRAHRPLLTALCLATSIGGLGAQMEWTPKQPIGMPPLHGAQMAFDEVRGRMLLYGGQNLSYDSDQTWEWDGTAWAQLFPAQDPGARSRHAMVYDSARGRMVLVGGYRAGFLNGETWEWDGTNWTQALPGRAALQRTDHNMVYDSARDRIVLFGGRRSGTDLGDTWEYDGSTWTQRFPAASPSPRRDHAMAYDPVRNRVMLFGGAGGGGLLRETWEYDGTTWTERFPLLRPQRRADGEMTFDTSRGRVVLYGGRLNLSHTSSAYEWDGSNWVTYLSSYAFAWPDGREGPAMSYDSARQELVIFGGHGDQGWLGDTWVLPGPRTQWIERVPGTRPTARWDHAMTYDEARGEVMLFGGGTGVLYRNDTWLWNGVRWHRAALVPGLTRRGGTALAYDSVRERVVLFGGWGGFARNDTWEWDGVTWTKRTPTVSPPERYFHAMAFDRERGQVVLFGGRSLLGRTYLRDTWVWDGSDWQDVSPLGAPFARAQHGMAYDEARKVVVMHGGSDASLSSRGDTWEWDGRFWLFKTGVSNTPSLARSSLVYDAARRCVVAHGGASPQGTTSDTWEWDGSAWTQRTVRAYVPRRMGHAMAYDSARRRVVQFGGATSWSPNDATWEYAPTYPADYTSFGQGCAGTAGTPALSARNGLLPWIGETFEFELSNLVPAQPAWVFVGASNVQWGTVSLPFNLGVLGFNSCQLFASGEIVLPVVNNQGVAIGALEVPPVTALLGSMVYLQALAGDPGVGISVSDAGALTFGAK